MNIYECWKKVRVHILITLFFAFAVPTMRYFGKDISDVFYLSYIINSAVVTVTCIVLNMKHGFLWYYPVLVLFVTTFALAVFFINDMPSAIPVMFVSYASLGYVSSAIGAIVKKIRDNNRDGEDEQ